MNDSSVRARRVRNLLRASGLVLWGLVLMGAYVVWQTSDEVSRKPTVAPNSASADRSHDVGANDEKEQSRRKGLRKRISASPEKEPPASPWDPEGIEDFELIERSGRTVTKADLLGKPWAVGFIFTKCAGPCLPLTGQMTRVQDELQDEDVRLVTITVDPKRDTLEELNRYADAFDADAERWWFLTGERDDIYRLITNSFKMPVKEMEGEDRRPGWEILHSTNILHVDAEGRVVGKYDGTDDAEVAALVRALKNDAAGEEPTDKDSDESPSISGRDEGDTPSEETPASAEDA